MTKRTDDLLAAITANTDALKSVAMGVSALMEGHATIAEEIAVLKAEIGSESDASFSSLESALAEQATIIQGIRTAIPAGTAFQPSNN